MKLLKKLSSGTIQRVRLYALFEAPPTICGCFEIATFYIPELDAIGLVHRGYTENTPIGLRFSQIADAVGGGKQVPGFQGIGILYLRSRKLFQADGDWTRIVWMPSELKERILDAIPPDLRDKIATEKDVSNVEELKKFLIEKGHPIAKKIIEMEKKVKEVPKKVEKAKPAEAMPQPTQIPISPAPQMQPKVVTSGSSSSNIHSSGPWRYYCYSLYSYTYSEKRTKYYYIT